MSHEKPLTGKQEAAAVLVADDTLTNEQIGAQVGVTRRQVDRWKTDARFQARVREHVAEAALYLQRYAIARKDKRIAEYDSRWKCLIQVRQERARDEALEGIPGASTGLIVQRWKMIGGGESAQLVREYEVDTGALSAQLALEKQASIESGQWTEKSEMTGKDGAPLFDLDKPVTVIYANPDETNDAP